MLNHARGAAERTARALSSTVDRSSSWIEQLEPTSRRGTVVGWFRLYRGADGPRYARRHRDALSRADDSNPRRVAGRPADHSGLDRRLDRLLRVGAEAAAARTDRRQRPSARRALHRVRLRRAATPVAPSARPLA